MIGYSLAVAVDGVLLPSHLRPAPGSTLYSALGWQA